MRNLKRALSLVMAMALIVGMMVVSAGAASTKDFTDKDEIRHTEAVNTMVALNVISGKEDGSYYDPTGTLTRAEMAKVIAYVMNGGVEPNIGTKVVPTYSDIDNHWAEAYIEYCTSMGIINGDGAGKFNPEGTLTASQAAKMFLTAIGYNATVFGLVGNDWETNTNRYANEAGLYQELGNVAVSQPISRDDAAQMAYNAIQATMMRRSWTLNPTTGEMTESYQPWTVTSGSQTVGYTLLNDKFNAIVAYGYMEAVDYDDARDEFTYTFTDSAKFGGAAITTQNYDGTLTTDLDVSDLYGQKVKVIYKDNNAKDVYGIYAEDSAVLYSGAAGDVTAPAAADTSVEIAGSTYRLDSAASAIDVYTYNAKNATGALTGMAATDAGYTFKLIDNDGNGRANVVVKVPFTVTTVTYVGTTSITLKDGGSKKLSDISVYDNVAVDDVVVTYDASVVAKDIFTVEKAETATGTVDATRTVTSGNNYRIDGTWYGNATSETIEVNDTIAFLAIGSKLYYVDTTSNEKTVDDILVVLGTKSTGADGITAAKQEANALFADGSKAVITTVDDDGDPAAATAGKMYTFDTNSDGEYILTEVGASNMAGHDHYGTGVTDSNNATTGNIAKANGYTIADDAVVFIYQAGTPGDGKVYTGKDLKSLSSASYTGTAVLSARTSGFEYAEVILVAGTLPTSVGTADNYGYLVAATSRSRDTDGTWYRNYQLWTADGLVEVREEMANSAGAMYNAGTIIGFTYADETTIEAVDLLSGDLVRAAITGWNGEDIAFQSVTNGSVTGTVTSDTVVLYVDDEDKEGAEGGAIAIAEELVTGGYVENAYYVMGDDDEVALIVFDVNNRLDGAVAISTEPPVTAPSSATAAQINALDPGVYVPADDSFAPGDVAGDMADNLIFRFPVTSTATTYTLTIKAADGTVVYQEAASKDTSSTNHFFYVTTNPSALTGNNSTSATGSMQNTPLTNGIYTYSVSNGTSDVLTGSFEISGRS